jgi:RNA polymerase sigma-70 factor (ECF subfamily)
MQKLSQAPGNNFSTKYHLYGSMLFKISMVHLGNKEDAEEAMQEAFYKLLYNSPEFKNDEHEKAWLIRTIINICKDMRKSSWYKRTIKTEEIEEYYDNSSDMDVMMEILRLPAKYKAVIHLHYFENYSIKEISEILQIKDSAIKMRLNRGRQLLKI